MPVSLSEWRIRIGRYLKRQKKEYDYNHFLAKIFNLLKRTYNVKFPSDARVPSRSTKNGTNNDTQNNSVPKSHSASNSSGSSTPSDSTGSKPAAAFSNLRDQETSVTTSTVNKGLISVETTPPPLSVDEYKDKEQSYSISGDDELDDRYITISPQSQTTVQSFKQDISPPFLKQSDRDPGIPLQSREPQRAEDKNLHCGMSTKNVKTYAPCCPVYDDDELDCREITIIPDIGFSSQGRLNREQPAPSPCHTVFHNVVEKSPSNLSTTSFTQDNLEVVKQMERHTVSSNRKSECSSSQETPQSNVNECPDVTSILLLRSGDVEMNPGPNNSSVTEEKLEEIATNFPHGHYYSFSKKLGIGYNQAESILNQSWGDYQRALMKNLMTWKNRTGGPSTELSDALANSGALDLVWLLTPSIEPDQEGDDILDDLPQQVIEDIKHHYISELCQIAADPLSNKMHEFNTIFTNLILLEEERGEEHARELPYKDLLKTKVNGIYPRRLMVEGEGGKGKSTLCAKIAWDWATGTGYSEFKLVLITLLRNARNKTVGEIVKTYLSDDNPVTAKQLNKYILSHQKEIFLAMDGLDELDGDLTADESADDRAGAALNDDHTGQHQIINIICNRLFMSGKVLITSRQWKSDQIRRHRKLKKAFAFIIIQGFSSENLKTYINQFFHRDKDSSADLIRFITEDDVVRENMSSFPIYAAMLCIMWKRSSRERRETWHKLHTFSKVIVEMVNFLVDHYLSKHMAPSDEKWNEERSRVRKKLEGIGEVAYRSLLKRKMVIEEGEFQDKESLEMGWKVGVLSKERRAPREGEPAISTVQFTHKLFQEYLSAMYLASLCNSTNHGEYEQLSQEVIRNPLEHRYLVYFAAALSKKVAMDMVTRIILNPFGHDHDDDDSLSRLFSPSSREKQEAVDNFLVDVAYESQDQAVIEKVREVMKWSWEMRNSLHIDYRMQAHSVSAHIFVRDLSELESIMIWKSFGRTVSRDLAGIMCTSKQLRSAYISGNMHDVFYSVLADHASRGGNFKITYLDVNNNLEARPAASRNLAKFICQLSCLKSLELTGRYGDGEAFYSALSLTTTLTEVETLKIGITDISTRSDQSRQLAKFLCRMPCLKTLKFHLGESSLHDDFYEHLCSAASLKIKDLEMFQIGLGARPGRMLARFICRLPRLQKLALGEQKDTHADFLSEASGMTSSPKIEARNNSQMGLATRRRTSRVLEFFMGKLSRLLIPDDQMDDLPQEDFYSEASRMTFAKIETLSVGNIHLADNSRASSGLATFICKLPYLEELSLGKNTSLMFMSMHVIHKLHDNFYSTLSTLASSMKIGKLEISNLNLHERPLASRCLAEFICKMASLDMLHIEKSMYGSVFHNEFFSSLSSLASSAKIKSFELGFQDLRSSPMAAKNLAKSICKMPHLKDLTMEADYFIQLPDEFFSVASSMASSSKIEKLVIKRSELSERPLASRYLAQFICQMASLKNLTIDDYQYSSKDRKSKSSLHDDFFSTLASMVSYATIESLVIKNLHLSERPSTLRNLAQFICGLRFLKSLTLESQLHEEFFSTLSSQACGKIETLVVNSEHVAACPSDSSVLAKCICEMTSLKNLTLRRLFQGMHDEFYSTLDMLASVAKIETLFIEGVTPHSAKTSKDLAHFICKLPHLKKFTMGNNYVVSLHKDFYSSLSTVAAQLKIETLCITLKYPYSESMYILEIVSQMPRLKNLSIRGYYGTTFPDDFYTALSSRASLLQIDSFRIRLDGNSGSPPASRNLAYSICKMPHLTNLALLSNDKAALHKDFFSTLAACGRVDGWRGASVNELTVADGLLVDWQHCRPMFDNVRKVRVCVKDTFHVSAIQQIQLPAATELIIQSDEDSFQLADFSEEPNTLPTVIQRAFPQLTKVTFSNINIGNGQIESILSSFSSARAQINTIRFLRCGQNEQVDDLIHNFNSRNTIKVDIEHGKPFLEKLDP